VAEDLRVAVMASRLVRPLWLTLLSCLVFATWALFEDEVGQYEWLVQQIGHPLALAYTAEATSTVFTASASGVVASVLLKDGSLQWRRISAAPGRIQTLRAGPRGLVSVTDRGFVQAWKGSSGDLTWQREYPDPVLELLVGGPERSQSVIVLRRTELEVRSMAGKHEWSVPAGLDDARFWAAAMSADGASICVVATREASAFFLQVDILTGTTSNDVEDAAVVDRLQRERYQTVGNYLVFLSDDSLTAYPMCGGESSTVDLRKLSSKGGPVKFMPWQQTPGVFAISNDATTTVFGVSQKGLKMLRTFDGVAVVGPVHSVHDDDEAGQPVAVAIMRDEGAHIQLLDPASGNVQPAILADEYRGTDHGNAELMLVKELSTGEHRTILVAEDHSIVGLQGSKMLWVREEALASIRQASFYSRSATHRTSRTAAPPSLPDVQTVIDAVSVQLSGLPDRIQELVDLPFQLAANANEHIQSLLGEKRPKKAEKANLLTSSRVPSSASELRSFGASKLVIAVTRASKLFALEATTSEIIWQRYFGTDGGSGCALAPNGTAPGTGEGANCGLWVQLLPSSSPSYSELLIVTPQARDGTQQFVWLDPLTGSELHRQTAPTGGSVISVMPLPTDEPQDPILPFVVVDSLRRVHVMPPTPASHVLLEKNVERLFHYEVNRETESVQGFAMASKEGSFGQLINLWNLELSLVGERIVGAASLEHREWEHVPVHIKGDASILYKYVNSNLLAVATEDAIGKGDVTSLNLYTMDAVTGHVFHQTRVQGASAPVHLAACDNWVLMHYWNTRKTRFEVTVIEFFEGKSDDGPWSLLFGGSENSSRSAHHLEPPVPLQQTFIFPTGVTSVGVTATLKGITPRSVILALSTDHILRVSKDILNARRPNPLGGDKGKIPSQFAPTKEEAVPPYAPMVQLKPTDVLNYYNAVGAVEGIISSPTALESTSMVFCFGLDLFFTPVRTASAYDVLSPGFNYTLLYASVGLVLSLLMVTWYYAGYKALQDKWR